MKSASAAILTLAGAVAFAGAAAYQDGGAMEFCGAIGGIVIALTGFFTWARVSEPPDPREPKP